MATLLARLFAAPAHDGPAIASAPMGAIAGQAPVQRDGMATALEAPATGFTPAMLDGMAEPPPIPARRARPPDAGTEALASVVAAKVLHFWLQNRHQTLFPLTVNLRTLDADAKRTLCGLMAVALLSDPAGPADRLPRAQDWLLAAGADAAMLDSLARAHASPPPLSTVLDDIATRGLAAYAYILALVATPADSTPGTHFLDYLAVRLALPSTVIRSANRRYRL